MSAKHPDILLKQGLLLLGVLLVAFVYHYRLGDKALDFYERYSLNIATGIGGHSTDYRQSGQYVALPISGKFFYTNQYHQRCNVSNVVSTTMNDNGHGLPYFLLLHVWLKITGISTWHARLPSAILMVIAVSLMYALLRKCGIQFYVALFITVLFACNGTIIGLAQYLRFYSLGLVLTLLSTWILLNVGRSRRIMWPQLIMGALWAIMFLTQFFMVFVVFAQALFALMRAERGQKLKILLPAGISFLAIVGIWLVPLHGWETFRNIYNMHTVERDLLIPSQMTLTATPGNVVLSLLGSLSGAVGQPVGFFGAQKTASIFQILAGIPAIGLIVILLTGNKEVAHPAWLRLCLLVIGIYALASVVHAFLSGYTLLFQGRYWVFSYPFTYLLLALALQRLAKERELKIRLVAFVAIALTTGRAFYTSASAVSGLTLDSNVRLHPAYIQSNPDYEGAAIKIAQTSGDGDTICYENWRVSQNVNCFLPIQFVLPQRVDSTQTLPIIVTGRHGTQTIAIPLARTLHARPLW
jgi:uncharacterized membrane protein